MTLFVADASTGTTDENDAAADLFVVNDNSGTSSEPDDRNDLL